MYYITAKHMAIDKTKKHKICVGVLFSVGVLFLSGCVTTKAPSTFLEPWRPDNTSFDKKYSKIEENDAVWRKIRGQEFDTSRRYGLLELAVVALQNNPSTRIAWENARSVEAQKHQAESAWYPTVQGTFDLEQSKTVEKSKLPTDNNINYGPSIGATFLLMDCGKRDANIRMQTWNLYAANYTFNQSIEDLILSVSKAYYELYSAQAMVKAAESDVQNTKTDYEAANEKFSAGLVTRLDVLQALSNYEDSRYSLEDAKGKLKTAQGTLAQVLGFSADTPIKIKSPWWNIPTDIQKADIKKMIEEALITRPDIDKSRTTFKAKEEAVKAAMSDLFPKVNAGSDIAANYYKYYNTGKEYGNNYVYSFAGITATWDIFDGFYNLSVLKQKETERDKQAEQLRSDELAASKDVWEKFYNFKTAVGKQNFSCAYFNTARVYYELAFESYNAGLKSMLDLVQAQDDLSKARSKFIQARKDLFVALVELNHAMGALYANGEAFVAKHDVKK